MEEREKEALTKNFNNIVERIDPKAMGIRLFEAGILSHYNIEEMSAERTRSDKAMKLMTFVFRSGSKKTYSCFIEALKNVGCNEELLEDIGKTSGGLRRRSLQKQQNVHDEKDSQQEVSDRKPSLTLNNLSPLEPSVQEEDNLFSYEGGLCQPNNYKHENLTLSSFGLGDSYESQKNGLENIAPKHQPVEHQMPIEPRSSGLTLSDFSMQTSFTNGDSECQSSSNETVGNGQIKLCTKGPGDFVSHKEETRHVMREICTEVKEGGRRRSSPVTQCHTVFYVYLELKGVDKPGIIVQPILKEFPSRFICRVDEIEHNSIAHSNGHIEKGDILIAVNDCELKRNHFESQEKMSLGCRRFGNTYNTVKLTVKRMGDQIWNECTVSLNSDNKPYGLRFINGEERERYPGDKDIYIAFVLPEYPAQCAGIRERDTLLAINGTKYESVADVTNILKNTTGEIRMRLKREYWEVLC